jgi:hypothetical protein
MTDEGVRSEQLRRWERERSAGRRSFAWRRGALGWGMPAALLTIGYKVAQEYAVLHGFALTNELRLGIAVSVIVFPLCGYLLALRLWSTEETKYQRFLQEGEERQPPR